MIYEMICNETGERVITCTEVYQEPLNNNGRIYYYGKKFSKSEKGENTYSFNLLEDCFEKQGITGELFLKRKRHYLNTLPNINTSNCKNIQEINENSLIYKKN